MFVSAGCYSYYSAAGAVCRTRAATTTCSSNRTIQIRSSSSSVVFQQPLRRRSVMTKCYNHTNNNTNNNINSNNNNNNRFFFLTRLMKHQSHNTTTSHSSSSRLLFSSSSSSYYYCCCYYRLAFFPGKNASSSIPKTTTTTIRSFRSSTVRQTRSSPTTSSHTHPTATVAAVTKQGGSNSRWHRLAKIVRFVRIPFIVLSVYSFGYQQGIIDCTKTPQLLHKQIMNSILISSGVHSDDDVQVIHEADVSMFKAYTEPHYQIAAVGQRILQSARLFVEEELQKAIDDVNETIPENTDPEKVMEIVNQNESVQFWFQAKVRLQGEHHIHGKNSEWRYIIVKNDIEPNAFVAEVLPHHFFITTALIQLANTPDQLAFVLGHEISHLLLGHVSRTNQIETVLHTIEVLFLSIDPTAGLLSLAFISAVYGLRKALSASFSREHEIQADELGLIITARACFDTVKGVDVMYKMHQHGISGGKSTTTKVPDIAPTNKDNNMIETPDGSIVLPKRQISIGGLLDTHPASLDRWERLKLLATTGGENYTKYPQICKKNVAVRFYNALLWR